ERRNKPTGSEPPHPVAERARGEAVRGDDDARAFGQLRELRVAHGLEREVAERAPAVPALVALLGDDPLRPRVRPQVGKRLEPLDSRVPVPELAAALGVVEVVEERLRVGLAEAEPAEPPQRLVRLQARIRRPPAGTPAPPASP